MLNAGVMSSMYNWSIISILLCAVLCMRLHAKIPKVLIHIINACTSLSKHWYDNLKLYIIYFLIMSLVLRKRQKNFLVICRIFLLAYFEKIS